MRSDQPNNERRKHSLESHHLHSLSTIGHLLFFIGPRFDHIGCRAGPKGGRPESAGAVTGRRCPHSGEGEDFLTGQPDFFTKTAVTPEQKVEKSFPRWEMNGHSEGYKWVIDQNWGRMAKIGFFGQKPRFWAQKKAHFCTLAMFWPRLEKVVQRMVRMGKL